MPRGKEQAKQKTGNYLQVSNRALFPCPGGLCLNVAVNHSYTPLLQWQGESVAGVAAAAEVGDTGATQVEGTSDCCHDLCVPPWNPLYFYQAAIPHSVRNVATENYKPTELHSNSLHLP